MNRSSLLTWHQCGISIIDVYYSVINYAQKSVDIGHMKVLW